MSVDEIEESQVISRSEAPDTSLKFWKIDNCTVADEHSVEYKFGEIYKDHKTIFSIQPQISEVTGVGDLQVVTRDLRIQQCGG